MAGLRSDRRYRRVLSPRVRSSPSSHPSWREPALTSSGGPTGRRHPDPLRQRRLHRGSRILRAGDRVGHPHRVPASGLASGGNGPLLVNVTNPRPHPPTAPSCSRPPLGPERPARLVNVHAARGRPPGPASCTSPEEVSRRSASPCWSVAGFHKRPPGVARRTSREPYGRCWPMAAAPCGLSAVGLIPLRDNMVRSPSTSSRWSGRVSLTDKSPSRHRRSARRGSR